MFDHAYDAVMRYLKKGKIIWLCARRSLQTSIRTVLFSAQARGTSKRT